jgi:U4/U6 small nuclear ribonucleoprotein PRP31
MGSRNAAAKVPLKSSEGRDQGCIFDAPLMSNVALEHLDQAGHQVGAKVVLVARVDLSPGNTDGSYGEEIKQQCLDKFDKTARPAPNAHAKALPAPDEKPSAKRGGKKVRKAKEATAMTEIRKAQNRIGFNKEEVEVGYGTGPGTVGMGMIGQEGTGSIRNLQANKATAAKVGKHHPGWGTQAQQPTSLDAVVPGAGLSATRGLRAGPGAITAGESTVLFAPSQSLQLADPLSEAALKRKREDESSRWFGSGVFTGAPAPQKPKTGPFKFPDLPEPKRAGETKEKPAE